MREVSAEERRLAHIIKEACIRAAVEGYELAAMSGLCHEGAWEAAIGAIQRLDVDTLLNEQVIE